MEQRERVTIEARPRTLTSHVLDISPYAAIVLTGINYPRSLTVAGLPYLPPFLTALDSHRYHHLFHFCIFTHTADFFRKK